MKMSSKMIKKFIVIDTKACQYRIKGIKFSLKFTIEDATSETKLLIIKNFL